MLFKCKFFKKVLFFLFNMEKSFAKTFLYRWAEKINNNDDKKCKYLNKDENIRQI